MMTGKADKPVRNSNVAEEPLCVSALKHLFCGGVAGSTAKSVTAPLSRLTILFQVHSLVTTNRNRPNFAMTFSDGLKKIVERDGFLGLWKGNGTSVLHRFPFSAINFFVYEKMLDVMTEFEQLNKKEGGGGSSRLEPFEPSKSSMFVSGATSGSIACVVCYPLDLVRARLTTELHGKEKYKGITDAVHTIVRTEGFAGLYSGLVPTLLVAVPNFALTYTVYGTLKRYFLDDDLFINLRKVDNKSGKEKLGFYPTLLCGSASGTLSSLITYPFDTVRRRMQIQSVHVDQKKILSVRHQIINLCRNEGWIGFYRGLTPELIKVVPMVGTLFLVYEWLKEELQC